MDIFTLPSHHLHKVVCEAGNANRYKQHRRFLPHLHNLHKGDKQLIVISD
jgi:hypothetical protein